MVIYLFFFLFDLLPIYFQMNFQFLQFAMVVIVKQQQLFSRWSVIDIYQLQISVNLIMLAVPFIFYICLTASQYLILIMVVMQQVI